MNSILLLLLIFCMLLFEFKKRKLITKQLLYYSWLCLQIKQKPLFYFFGNGFVEPLSKSWFNKSAILLKKGRYTFLKKNNNKTHNSNKFILRTMKNKTIEKTFLVILKLNLFKKISLDGINLTECLRL